jgi:hypothetical protein
MLPYIKQQPTGNTGYPTMEAKTIAVPVATTTMPRPSCGHANNLVVSENDRLILHCEWSTKLP